MDLFGDLPEPAGCQSASKSEPVVSTTNGEQDKEQRLKRKFTDVLCTDTTTFSPTEAKHRLTVNYSLKGFVKELKGERDEMQDAHVVINDYAAQFESLHPSICRMALYGVFDGHGGARAASFASENLHVNLRTVIPKVTM